MIVEAVREWPEEVEQYIHSLVDKNASLETENEHLREKLRLGLFRRFGRSSEKIDPNQQELFAEAEVTADASADDTDEIEVPGHKRRKAGRKPLAPSLPREEILHDLSDQEKRCACGAELSRIRDEIREELEIIPEQVFVKKHIDPIYSCRCCEGSGGQEKRVFRMAVANPRLLPGRIASPALMAFILVNKFVDHLPFYRQEKRFERIGAHISRQDMSNWTIRAYQMLGILEEFFIRKIKEGPVIQMDERPLQVMTEPGRSDTKKSYMWPAREGPPDSPLVLYRYHTGRDSAYIKDFLDDFRGYLESDGLEGYPTALKENDQIVHVGCLPHVRRRFHDAKMACSKSTGAHLALSKIQKIYLVEKRLREEHSGMDLVEARGEQVLPLLDEFKAYWEKKSLQVRPSSGFGRAIS